tara:strand:+ start:863 stop:985 length:123 start_codon:yes stop_codon:yes gene_type:complete
MNLIKELFIKYYILNFTQKFENGFTIILKYKKKWIIKIIL